MKYSNNLFLFTLLSLGFIHSLQASLGEKKIRPKNCFINILTTYKTGETTKKYKAFKLSDKDKCEKARQAFSQNFSPKRITKVEAKMEWIEE